MEFLRKNKKALFGAVALTGLGVGGLGLADVIDPTDPQTDGLIGFVVLGGGLIFAAVKTFLAKKAGPTPPAA